VSWAGARGVVPLAAALSIPLTTVSGAALPYRDLILVLATAVIAISLIVQGFTLGPLARFAGLARPPADAWRQEAMARLRLAEAGLARVDELASLEAVPAVVIDRLRHDLQARISRSRDRMEYGMTGDGLADSTYRRIRRDLIAVENTELGRLYAAGTVSEATRRRLQRTLDLEAAALGDE
jgi:CPA1 family monovalent cation:H+ antiporter